MLTKRRSSFRLQLLCFIALFGLAYLFYPRSERLITDSWYEDSEFLKELAQSPKLAALANLKKQLQQPSSVTNENLLENNPNRVKAAFVILARNSDLTGIRQSIRQLEDRFNKHFNYPYVFLNEEYFSDEFKQKTKDLTKAQTFYGKIDQDMWGYPDFINQTYAAECRQDMHNRKIIYGGSESYRHMCR